MDDGLDVAVEIETPLTTLATDAGLPRPAERRGEIANEEAVHPYRAGNQRAGDAVGTRAVGREECRGKAVIGVIGQGDELRFARERLDGEDRPKHLAPEDLGRGRRIGEQG